jgi:diguanylate cyclase (GGDEF)-like protein
LTSAARLIVLFSRLKWQGMRRGMTPRLLPWAVLIAGLSMTLLAVAAQQRFSQVERERLAKVLADDISAALHSRLATNQTILAAVVGLFNASEEVTGAEFARFFRALSINNATLAGIQGVGYAARITPAAVGAFEQRIRRQGQPDFRMHPPGRRPLMSAIVYLEPADWRKERAMGFDMASEATRRQAMAWAALSGDAVLSGPVRLKQETDVSPQVGTLLYMPIYASEQGFRSPDNRWRRLRGWAYLPVRMSDLVASVLETVSNPDRSDAGVLLFDGERPQQSRLLYDSRGLSQRLASTTCTWVPMRLADRTLLMEELQRALALAQRRGEGEALLFLDLNGFKAVNDRHGHSTGDALLQCVAQRLQRLIRASDLLCRQGGDEFVLMIGEAPDDDRLLEIATKLLESLAAPYPELPGDVRLSASVGVARWPDHAEDADGLLNAADNSVYAAKQRSRQSPAIALAERLDRSAAAAPASTSEPESDAGPGHPAAAQGLEDSL